VEGWSLGAQLREIKRYAEQQGIRLVRTYSEPGVSAHTDQISKRPILAGLLLDAAQNQFDLVIVHTLDRWARNIRVQFEALHQLGTFSVGFVSVSENVDYSTPHSRLSLTMLGGFAEFFSAQLGVHVKKSQRSRAEAGLPVGPVPFGFRVSEPGGTPLPIPEEAAAVKRAFTARAAGKSNGEIASSLNDQGFTTRKGRRFTAHAVKDLLNCRFFVGVVPYKSHEYPGRHEAIVDLALFERAQMRRARRGASRRIRDHDRSVLGKLIKCAKCGNNIHAERGHKGRAMYRERHGWPCPTNRRSFMAASVDEQVGEIFRSIELEDDWADRIATATVRAEGPSVEDLRDRRKRMIRGYVDGGLSHEEYEVRLTRIDTEFRLIAPATPVEIDDAASILKDLPEMWEQALPDERRTLIGSLIEAVYVDGHDDGVAGFELLAASTEPAALFREHHGAVGFYDVDAIFVRLTAGAAAARQVVLNR
jgi:DNA invertase Pin-like site-specific DNA recombinase